MDCGKLELKSLSSRTSTSLDSNQEALGLQRYHQKGNRVTFLLAIIVSMNYSAIRGQPTRVAEESNNIQSIEVFKEKIES